MLPLALHLPQVAWIAGLAALWVLKAMAGWAVWRWLRARRRAE